MTPIDGVYYAGIVIIKRRVAIYNTTIETTITKFSVTSNCAGIVSTVFKNKVMGKKIILINPAYIQWDDYSFLHRPGWANFFSIEQMEEMAKDIKNYD